MRGGQKMKTPGYWKQAEIIARHQDLMHYVHGTGKYARLKREMLRKYHPDREYIGEIGNRYERYRLLQDYEVGAYPYNVDQGISWWKKLIKDNPNTKIAKIAEHEISKLEKHVEKLWNGLGDMIY